MQSSPSQYPVIVGHAMSMAGGQYSQTCSAVGHPASAVLTEGKNEKAIGSNRVFQHRFELTLDMANRLAKSTTKRLRATGTAIAALAAMLSLGCSSTPDHVPAGFAAQAMELERRTLEDVVLHFPKARAALDRAVGYAVFANEATKVPVVGRGEGLGIAVDKRNDARHFVSVTHFDVGGGLGSMTYRLVIVFFDQQDFERLRTGTLHVGASIDAVSAGKTGGFGSPGRGKADKPKRAVYVLADSGATATWIVRLVRFKPLTDE